MTKKKCAVAIVGAGYMAREHIRAFQDIEQVSIVGITSRTRSRAEVLAQEFQIRTVCDSVDELFETTQADLVVVTVPELSANSVSAACFKHPWMILLEKPVGYNLADAEEIERNAQAHNARAYVALNRRYYSSTRSALADLANATGERFIHMQDQEDQIRALQAGQPRPVVDNWMFANSIHVVDYFSMFARGNPVSVECVIPWDPERSLTVAAKIQFDSGDSGIYEGIWNAPGPWFASIHTREKRWEMRPLEKASYQLAGQRNLEVVEPHVWDQQFKPGLRLQAEAAVRTVQGESTDLPTLQDSLKSMRLVQQIYFP